MATFTNIGATLIATAWQTPGAQVAPTYAAIGGGCGTLASALSSGTAYTSLPLVTGLPATLSRGARLTLLDAGGDMATVTTSATVSAGATVIPITSFTPSVTFATGSGVTTTPSATDTALFNESYRVAAVPGAAGAQPGESLNGGYFDSTAPTATYVEVGYFGGLTATATPGSGILLARDVGFWAHTVGSDSVTYTLESTLSLT